MDQAPRGSSEPLPLITRTKQNEAQVKDNNERIESEGVGQAGHHDMFPRIKVESTPRNNYEAVHHSTHLAGVLSHPGAFKDLDAKQKKDHMWRTSAAGATAGAAAVAAIMASGAVPNPPDARTGSSLTTEPSCSPGLFRNDQDESHEAGSSQPQGSDTRTHHLHSQHHTQQRARHPNHNTGSLQDHTTPVTTIVLQSKDALLLEGPAKAVHNPGNPLLEEPEQLQLAKQRAKVTQRREQRAAAAAALARRAATIAVATQRTKATTAMSLTIQPIRSSSSGVSGGLSTSVSSAAALRLLIARDKKTAADRGSGAVGLQMEFASRRSASLASVRGDRRISGDHKRAAIRPKSRIGALLREFQGKEDWVSNVVIRQKMAIIIQAYVRGHLVRIKWRVNPQGVILALREKQATALKTKLRHEDLRRKLEVRALTQKQKTVVAPLVSSMLTSQSLKKAKPLGKLWGKLQKNVDIATAETANDPDDESEGSEYSDVELEDLAAVKFRAKTPPWQKVERSQWVGQYAKLQKVAMRGNLDTLWDLDRSNDRVEQVRGRRQDSEPASGKVLLANGRGTSRWDPVTDELPPDLVNDMLLERYMEKYTRLGLGNEVMVRHLGLCCSSNLFNFEGSEDPTFIVKPSNGRDIVTSISQPGSGAAPLGRVSDAMAEFSAGARHFTGQATSTQTQPDAAASNSSTKSPASSKNQDRTPSTITGNGGENSDSAVSSQQQQHATINSIKLRLLSSLASLDRGLAANARQAAEVDGLAQQLEHVGGGVTLNWRSVSGTRSTLDTFSGMWRLLYTSGFNTGSLGGQRPGPPAALVPSILGQIYQQVDPQTVKLDNIVEFLLPSLPLPLPMFGSSRTERKSPALRLTLRHEYEVEGSSTVRIVFEDSQAELVGSSWFKDLPKFTAPQLPEFLKPPRDLRSATFEVTYLDDNTRITRGDRGELRIYVKDADQGVSAPGAAPWPPTYDD